MLSNGGISGSSVFRLWVKGASERLWQITTNAHRIAYRPKCLPFQG